MIGSGPLPLIVLDRDGVINRDSPDYIKSVSEWQPLPGSMAAMAALSSAGFRVAVATNQSGLGRGLFTEATLAAIHRRMIDAVREAGGDIAGIYYCPHLPGDGCECRKPKPGLLFAAAKDAGVTPERVIFIGDKPSDVGAARAAGAQPIRIMPDRPGSVDSGAVGDRGRDARVPVYPSLRAAVDALLIEWERR